MPLPTLRLPTASTSCLEFLGLTVSGEAMGTSAPGSPFFLASAGGAAGCGGGGSGAGAALGSCAAGCPCPDESCDCASAIPEQSSAASSAPKSFGNVGCMILPHSIPGFVRQTLKPGDHFRPGHRKQTLEPEYTPTLPGWVRYLFAIR